MMSQVGSRLRSLRIANAPQNESSLKELNSRKDDLTGRVVGFESCQIACGGARAWEFEPTRMAGIGSAASSHDTRWY
jgi:hypothetical protein